MSSEAQQLPRPYTRRRGPRPKTDVNTACTWFVQPLNNWELFPLTGCWSLLTENGDRLVAKKEKKKKADGKVQSDAGNQLKGQAIKIWLGL